MPRLSIRREALVGAISRAPTGPARSKTLDMHGTSTTLVQNGVSSFGLASVAEQDAKTDPLPKKAEASLEYRALYSGFCTSKADLKGTGRQLEK